MKLTLLLLVFTANLHAAEAYFVYASPKDSSYDVALKAYTTYNIIVNGTAITEYDKKYKVTINSNGLDVISARNNGIYHYDTIYARLKPGKTYTFTFNMCSGFEIIPSKETSGQELVRLISVNRDTSKLYLNNGLCFIEAQQIWNRDTTDYFQHASSGLCPYAMSTFSLCPKPDEDIRSKEDAATCHDITLYFSGGERYSLIYDYAAGKLSVKLEK